MILLVGWGLVVCVLFVVDIRVSPLLPYPSVGSLGPARDILGILNPESNNGISLTYWLSYLFFYIVNFHIGDYALVIFCSSLYKSMT